MKKRKAQTSNKYTNGLNMYRKEFDKGNPGLQVDEENDMAIQKWKAMREEERYNYHNAAKLATDAYQKEQHVAKAKAKTPILTRCSPMLFQKLVDGMDQAEKDIVSKMGFKALLQIDCKHQSQDLVLELVKRFDWYTCSLAVRGANVTISELDVAFAMGIPRTEKSVDNANISSKELDEVTEVFGTMKFKDLKGMISLKQGEKTFKRAFLLYTLGVLLCPTSSMKTSKKLVKAVVDIDHVDEYNWAGFVLQWLVNEVKKFKVKGDEKKSIGGCIYFLMIIFFHYFPLGQVLVNKHDHLIMHWNFQAIEGRVKMESESELGILRPVCNAGIVLPTVNSFQLPLFKDVFAELTAKLTVDAYEMLKPLEQIWMEGNVYPIRKPPTNEDTKSNEWPSTLVGVNRHDDAETPPNSVASNKGSYTRKRKMMDDLIEEGKVEDIDALQVKDELMTQCYHRSGRLSTEVQFANYTQPSDARIEDANRRNLYEHCTQSLSEGEDGQRILISMFGCYLSRQDLTALKPRAWISTSVMSMASGALMAMQKTERGNVWRHILDPSFMQKSISQLENWKVEEMEKHFHPGKVGYNIAHCKWIFIPMLHKQHWFCYALDPTKNEMYILDSMKDGKDPKKRALAEFMGDCLRQILDIINPGMNKRRPSIVIKEVELPQQPNLYDCGVYCIKYLEEWDSESKEEWGGLTMPHYSQVQLNAFRRQLVWEWVHHPSNESRVDTLLQFFKRRK